MKTSKSYIFSDDQNMQNINRIDSVSTVIWMEEAEVWRWLRKILQLLWAMRPNHKGFNNATVSP
jgi:hypothetical protein